MASPERPPFGSGPIARRLGRPFHSFRSFLDVEAAGGVLLLLAAVVAVTWANSPWRDGYASLWGSHLNVALGRYRFDHSLVELIDDGLMAVFFFVIGLEIKREWVRGELRDRRAAVLPAVAALGGMLVPAALYLLVDHGSPTSHGWGIPMATDIAFALGALTLLGRRVPSSLKVFLLTLAIVDDLGAIVVIAVFYAGDLRFTWLLVAVLGLALIVLLRSLGVEWLPAYVLVAVVVWFSTWQSGVHPTIAGVALGLLTPAYHPSSTPPLDRLEEALHPWTSFLIVPLFALANAGVALSGGLGGEGGRVTLGVVTGLVVGKTVGVAGASWLVVRLGLSPRPVGASWPQVTGVAALAGIGFTMSLFVTDLAFAAGSHAESYVDHAKVGVLAGSMIAALAGSTILFIAGRRTALDVAET